MDTGIISRERVKSMINGDVPSTTKEFKTGKISVIELLDAVGVGAFDVYLMQTLGKKRKRDNDSQQNQE